VLDSSPEFPLYPNASFDISAFRKVLVLAPHPDDEVYGCGGLLRLLVEQGAIVHVLVFTNGAQGGDSDSDELITRRRAESQAAATVIGYSGLTFLDYEDRSLGFDDGLIQTLLESLAEHQPDLVLAPAITERHPDHQVLALAAVEALRQLDQPVTLGFYEVSAPLIANALIDISSVFERKARAMSCFATQEALEPYRQRLLALNQYRAYSLGADVAAAEAYQIVAPGELRRSFVSLLQPALRLRRSQQLAIDAAELPLVSVIIRSVDRPSLNDAIASVIAQTYPRIEMVVIDATGGRHRRLLDYLHNRSVRLVQSEQPLSRAAAANAGLHAARGDELIFLDDDDFFYPQHIARLVQARAQSPQNLAAYAGVEVVDAEGKHLLTYDHPWEFERLLVTNFLPIHAVLFSRRLLDQGCRIDENLPILEDWDFWLQIAQLTTLSHVPGVSAVYRYGKGFSEHTKHYRQWRRTVVMKWLEKLGTTPFEQAFFWAATHLDEASQLVTYREKQLAECQNSLNEYQAQLADMLGQLQHVQQETRMLQTTLDSLLSSRSWRITQPLRRFSQLIDRIR
jgi:LmbE family N-acetylglucosaminyl deacetylase